MPPRRTTRNRPEERGGSEGGNSFQTNDNQGRNNMDALLEFLRQNANDNRNGPPPNPPTNIAASFKAFKSLHPPEFQGSANPVEARAWLKEMEKSFTIVAVGEGQKTNFAAYLLKGEANYWWESKQALEREGVITWERFTKLFLEKYFPKYMESQMEMKFLELKQNDLSVADYEAKFTELSRFVPHFVDTEEKRARRFQQGLKAWIQNRVAAFELIEYTKVVQKASIIEAGSELSQKEKEGRKRKRESQEESSSVRNFQSNSQGRSGFQQGRSEGFKRTESRAFSQGGGQGSVAPFRQSRPLLLECKSCGKKHTGVCRKSEGKCYNCGQGGHYSNHCPKPHVTCYQCGGRGHMSRDCEYPTT